MESLCAYNLKPPVFLCASRNSKNRGRMRFTVRSKDFRSELNDDESEASVSDAASAFAILGADPKSSSAELKAAFRAKVLSFIFRLHRSSFQDKFVIVFIRSSSFILM